MGVEAGDGAGGVGGRGLAHLHPGAPRHHRRPVPSEHRDTFPSAASVSTVAGSLFLDLPSGEGRFAWRISFFFRLRAIARALQNTRRVTRSTFHLAKAYCFFSRAAI